MASILRQIVAGPRAQHPEAGLDLCYVTDNIIATSGPGATYPQVAYRNPLKDLVKFLDSKHADKWAIWEFRSEGTGYPDSEVYNRIHHYPWPDHHPPPFHLVPLIMASMRNWLKDSQDDGHVVVVHCKAGKGRSGTMACSYLISEEGWTPETAMQRFTERRMRPGFGVGISIPSQQRWIRYVDRWTRNGKLYVERPVEITELHIWGLRDGVKIAVEGFVDEGKTIKKFHTFHTSERTIVKGAISNETGFANVVSEVMGRQKSVKAKKATDASDEANKDDEILSKEKPDDLVGPGGDVIYRPSSRVVLPSSDVNIDFERRNKTKYTAFALVTSVAHVWFNAFFEGNGPENGGNGDDSGVFELEWDAMDGIKGSSRKGTRAFDKFAVVWKALDVERKKSNVIEEPPPGEEVKESEAADWRGERKLGQVIQKKLGLRPETTDSAAVSRASSTRSHTPKSDEAMSSSEELQGVKPCLTPDGEDSKEENETNTQAPTASSNDSGQSSIPPEVTETPPQIQLDGVVVSEPENTARHPSTEDLPDGRPESEMKDHKDASVGSLKFGRNLKTSS